MLLLTALLLTSVLFVFNSETSAQTGVSSTFIYEGQVKTVTLDFSTSTTDLNTSPAPNTSISGGTANKLGATPCSAFVASPPAGTDFCADSEVWDADDETLTFEVTAFSDTRTEGDETFTVEVSDTDLDSETFTFTVKDPVSVSIAPSSGTAATEGEDAVFTVTASPAPVEPVTVSLTVTDDGPGDMLDARNEGSGKTVTIAANQTSAEFRVPTDDDAMFEDDGAVTVTVDSADIHTVGSPSTATVAVQNDDPDIVYTVGVSPLAVSVFEGDAAAFAVTALPTPTAPLTVNLTVSDASGSDFLNSSQQGSRTVTITVPAGDDRYDEPGYAEVAIPTVNDRAREASGDIRVTVNGGPGYTVTTNTVAGQKNAPRSSATLRINDDDGTLPVVTIAGGGTVTEGSEAVFTLTANPAPAQLTELIVNLTVGDVSGSDFLTVGDEGKGRKAVIPAGASTVTWRLPTVDDTTDEASGEVRVFLGAGRGYRVGSAASASVQVDDDDGLPSMDSEPQPSTLQIVRDSELLALIQARIDLTASRGDKHSNRIWRRALAAVQGTSPPLGLQPLKAPLAWRLADNHGRLGNAELSALWQRIAHALLGATVRAQQSEPPVLPVVTITAGPAVSEGDPARFTLRASPAPKSNLTVTLAVSEKGSLGDHVAASDEGWAHATIAAGSTQTVFTVPTVDDREHEPDGPVTVAVGSGTGYAASPVEFAQVTITDDDAYPLMSVSAGGSVVEGGTAQFTISADLAPVEAITIYYELSQSGKVLTTGGTSIRSALLSAGQTSLTLDVPTLEDAHFNADRWLKLSLRGSLSYPYRLGTPESATVTVTNDDAKIALPTLSISNGHAGESSRLITFTVTLSAASERPVEVFVRTRETSPVSARAWQDFIPRSSQLVRFAPGETSQQVATFLLDDNVTEGTERFELQLYRAKGAKIAKAVAIGTIVD